MKRIILSTVMLVWALSLTGCGYTWFGGGCGATCKPVPTYVRNCCQPCPTCRYNCNMCGYDYTSGYNYGYGYGYNWY